MTGATTGAFIGKPCDRGPATEMSRADLVRLSAFPFALAFLLQLSACSGHADFRREATDAGLKTTYEKLLALADSGDVEGQNAVGFMLYYGEGVTMDHNRAEMWFWLAAEQGNARARRNLAFLYSMGRAAPPRETDSASTQARLPGEALYERFCAGCHGFNGIAAYVHSPSFALGQTLEKSDEELMRSLLNGKGEMPEWSSKLSRAQLSDVLRFVRTLRLRYEAGLGAPLRGAPTLYFLFGPMESRDPNVRPVP